MITKNHPINKVDNNHGFRKIRVKIS